MDALLCFTQNIHAHVATDKFSKPSSLFLFFDQNNVVTSSQGCSYASAPASGLLYAYLST